MFGLPEDFDPAGFVGRSIEMVSFSANTVHFVFDGDYSLTLESSFEHRPKGGGTGPLRFQVPAKSSGLMSLIGRPVVSAEEERPGTLCLRFDDGQVLRCFDDSDGYESYKINCGGTEIIV